MPRNPPSAENVSITFDDENTDNSTNDPIAYAFIPDANLDDTYSSDNDDDNDESTTEQPEIIEGSYEKIYNDYSDQQTLLQEKHEYQWIDGETRHIYDLSPKNFLNIDQQNNVKNMSKTDIFELFFSDELKNHVLEASKENGLELSVEEFNRFIGILLFSIFNIRKCARDYWSKSALLQSTPVVDAMSRNNFFRIKNRLKFAKKDEKKLNDPIWRIRSFAEKFRKLLQQFGFFVSNMSIDESMIEFFGRISIKQFMPLKPIRFGIKLWSLCTIHGFLLDFQIYCGKQSLPTDDKLQKCALGTQVVMKMLHDFLLKTPTEKIGDYHVAFDNFFTNPDLMVHLNELGLKATGTVRRNRVYEMKEKSNKKGKLVPCREIVPVNLNEKSSRGDFTVKHDDKSETNYITVKDSKLVSVLSTAAGVEPLTPVSRYSKAEGQKVSIDFPAAFSLYNKTMGGVDLHDQHCSDAKINIKGKKWTWVVFCRVISASISNAFILWQHCEGEDLNKKYGIKEFVIEIADEYLSPKEEKFEKHKICRIEARRKCHVCPVKISTHCLDCAKHYCVSCFKNTHGIDIYTSTSRRSLGYCEGDNCKNRKKRTSSFCEDCDNFVCPDCFKGYHQLKKFKSI